MWREGNHLYLQSSGLAGTGLSLGDDILALDDGHDSTLLDGGGSLETGLQRTESDHPVQKQVAKFFPPWREGNLLKEKDASVPVL